MNPIIWDPDLPESSPPLSDATLTTSNSVILGMLGTLTAQLETINSRLAKIEERMSEMEHAREDSIAFSLYEHNERARAVNKQAKGFMSFLMPLYDAKSRPVPGFPSTVGYLAHLFGRPQLKSICESFGLNREDLKSLVDFIGADYDTVIDALKCFIPREERDRSRAMRALARTHRNEKYGPPTAETRASATKHNFKARAHNLKAKDEYYGLMPLCDEYGLLVDDCPKTLGDLANFGPKSEYMHLLQIFGQSMEEEGYRWRLVDFLGAPRGEVSMNQRSGRSWWPDE